MSTDRIQQAIEAGKQNLETMKLLRNWCAHVTVHKHGGAGLVEMQTGLPIGHHFLECPHAPAGGMAAWDLADTALDFYDRNCVDCKHRQPVGLPNISKLVSERDARRKVREQEQARTNQEREEKLAARESQRQAIRRTLDPVSATTLDQISEFDRTRTDQTAQRIVELADLAPETFRPEITEYLFSQFAAGEYWLFDPALHILCKLNADPTRLCNAALQALRSDSARNIAADIIGANASLARDDLIAPALPSLIRLANPMSSPLGMGRPQRLVSKPFRELYRFHPSTVKDGLKSLLEKNDAYDVRLAARGIEALSKYDPTILDFLPLPLIAKLVRSKHLVQGREEDVTEALDDVRSVVTRTFVANPQETDALIEQYLVGASKENAAELYKVYDEVLRDVRFDGHENMQITDAHRLAFRRMVVVATNARDEETIDATAGLFHGDPYLLTPLAAEEISLLLGSAAVLATKLTELEDKKPERTDELYVLQRMNRRSHLTNLMQCFVRWSCVAAGRNGEKAIAEVLEFMRALPESSTNLRGAIVGGFDAMMVSVDTLQQCLPDYYSALVGSEALLRSYAVTVLGELRSTVRHNMPSLVFEAFAALLTDPFVIVHRAAVRALGRFRLPENLNATVIAALSNLIVTYSQDRNSDEFLMTTIDLYAHRYLTPEHIADEIGTTLIAIMQRMPPYLVAREVRHSGSIYLANGRYTQLLLRLMGDDQAMSLYHEQLISQLRRISRSAVKTNLAAIVGLGKRLASNRRYHHDIGFLIELLTSAGAWKEAVELSSAAYNGIDDNTRNKPIRLHTKLRVIATTFEESLSDGKLDSVGPLQADWIATLAEIEKDNEVNRLRRDPLRGLLGSR
jgi:hypothetical protein